MYDVQYRLSICFQDVLGISLSCSSALIDYSVSVLWMHDGAGLPMDDVYRSAVDDWFGPVVNYLSERGL